LKVLAELFGATIVTDLNEPGLTHIVTSRQEQEELLKMIPHELAQSIIAKRTEQDQSSSSSSSSDNEDEPAAQQRKQPALSASGSLSLSMSGELSNPPSPKVVRKRVFLVAYNWIRESAKNWKRADEKPYLLPFSTNSFTQSGEADVGELR